MTKRGCSTDKETDTVLMCVPAVPFKRRDPFNLLTPAWCKSIRVEYLDAGGLKLGGQQYFCKVYSQVLKRRMAMSERAVLKSAESMVMKFKLTHVSRISAFFDNGEEDVHVIGVRAVKHLSKGTR